MVEKNRQTGGRVLVTGGAGFIGSHIAEARWTSVISGPSTPVSLSRSRSRWAQTRRRCSVP